MILSGVVTGVRVDGRYYVEARAGDLRRTVVARKARRLVENRVALPMGARVRLEVSLFDLAHGEITWRLT